MILGMQIIQILSILFGLFMLYYAFLNFKRKEFNVTEFTVWVVLWILFILAAVSPGAIYDIFIRGRLGIQRPLDFYIILGFMFVIALGFHTYCITKKNQKKLEKIVREIAFKQQEEK